MSYVSPDQDPFRAIADPRRRSMLDAMMEGERTVGELTRVLGVSQPTVSQHLQVLKLAGLVVERRSGRNNFYRTNPAELATIGDWLEKYRGFWNDRLDALERHLANKRN
ncbi:MAG: ArsR/SmtB family transcription factor [Labrys sp. (in: a-proteobacteria)]|jgi:DNA-binding transcriptional ArsR family regulator